MSVDLAGSGRRPRGAVRLDGRLDASTGNATLHELLAALEPDRMLVVDLSGVEFVDHAGAEILATARRQALVLGGDLHLIGASAHPLLSGGAT
ncbi:hypothetical protein SCMU_29310 [Sinomonas cyclohexanicum]|uniref:STAS domain-containing protein n=1 Tax=Sinomonas cyclohexanicum TaxID=322009 RepID=A0ABN6FK71_SINCY|nr:STAS domain-containing protein [Corynebacterium cyclohexanicum]BCT77089.1 hypothetical protein SCMU_29310 [Corynebacterium cyclohexanicum]